MNPKFEMLFVYLTMLISAIIFVYIFMIWNDAWNKAKLYELYEAQIKSFQKCLPYKPVCICQGGV